MVELSLHFRIERSFVVQTKQTIARMLPTLRAVTEFAEFKCKAQQSLMNEKKRKIVKIIIKDR